MNPERWRQVDQLFQAVLERVPEERAVFINEACGDDDSLRREVEKLLVADGEAGSLIEAPAYAVAAPLLVGGDTQSLLGKSIGHYQIISLLGKGGMGEVYAATDTQLGRKVAVKLLPAEFTRDAGRVRRFKHEARAASALNHPNIVTIHELTLMKRSPNERVTAEVAWEICERQNLKALIAGSLAPLGSHYVITLEAINGQSGETLAREQAEAENKEQVLRALSHAATRLRGRLGESLSSIQRFNRPLYEGTTAKLEAFKAYSQGIELAASGRVAVRGETKERAAQYATEQALRGAVFGDCRQARAGATQGLKLARGRASLPRAALALALCNEVKQAKPLVDELTSRYPEDTLLNSIWLPAISAVLELQRGNAALAVDQLQTSSRYEAAAEFWPEYLRGQAYLQLKQGEAAAEFQKILDHRGYAPLSPLYPLARLGLARAVMMSGDTAKARQTYESFLALWKDADDNLPALIEAKRDFEKLR